MHDYYAARAPQYDRVYDKPERQADLRSIEHWLPTVLGGRSLVEVACGTGWWTRLLAPAAAEVIAIDASAEVLAIAKARVAGDHVAFVRGDAYRLPLVARRFDAAFAGFWFSHVPRARIADFLCALHHVLAPGAKVVLLDNRFVVGSSTPIDGYDDDGNAYQLRTLDDGSVHRVLKNFPTETELRSALAGFAADASFHEWQHYWAMAYVVAAR